MTPDEAKPKQPSPEAPQLDPREAFERRMTVARRVMAKHRTLLRAFADYDATGKLPEKK